LDLEGKRYGQSITKMQNSSQILNEGFMQFFVAVCLSFEFW